MADCSDGVEVVGLNAAFSTPRSTFMGMIRLTPSEEEAEVGGFVGSPNSLGPPNGSRIQKSLQSSKNLIALAIALS